MSTETRGFSTFPSRRKDGRYALAEFKLGESEVAQGAEHLCEIERLVKEHNATESQCPIPLLSLSLVITGSPSCPWRNAQMLLFGPEKAGFPRFLATFARSIHDG